MFDWYKGKHFGARDGSGGQQGNREAERGMHKSWEPTIGLFGFIAVSYSNMCLCMCSAAKGE